MPIPLPPAPENPGGGRDAPRETPDDAPVIPLARDVQVAPSGITPLDPKSAAGVDLAKIVLTITAVSILLLLSYLLIMDAMVAYDVHSAYETASSAGHSGSATDMQDRLKRLGDSLNDAQKNLAKVMSPDDLRNARITLQMLSQIPGLTTADEEQLEDCLSPAASDSSRLVELNNCVDILAAIKGAALQAAANPTSSQLASDSANKIAEQRQAFHTFWIQAAQLILLNLLLPLLTALFGYIFGTQMASRS